MTTATAERAAALLAFRSPLGAPSRLPMRPERRTNIPTTSQPKVTDRTMGDGE